MHYKFYQLFMKEEYIMESSIPENTRHIFLFYYTSVLEYAQN